MGEIGVRDRTAREFRHGNDYFEPFLWERFASEFPNPLQFTIGRSNPATDWNFAQSSYWKEGKRAAWPWRIHFTLADPLPTAGDATLTLAFASADGARIDVQINDTPNLHAKLYPAVERGNALVREGIHAKYCLHHIAIPVAKLRPGANTITLTQGRPNAAANHVMYDYLSLELPDVSAKSDRSAAAHQQGGGELPVAGLLGAKRE
ncbi:MAG TPA: polysaccharide lyase family protein [Chthoniobacteraceae bacterium]|jgi:rhamnogalacturonan endolyase